MSVGLGMFLGLLFVGLIVLIKATQFINKNDDSNFQFYVFNSYQDNKRIIINRLNIIKIDYCEENKSKITIKKGNDIEIIEVSDSMKSIMRCMKDGE